MKHKNQYEYIQDIEIDDPLIDISEDSFRNFISSCQNEYFEINDSNVIELHHLSVIYEVPNLISLTKKYIKNHDISLVLKFIQYYINIQDEMPQIDLVNEENIIVTNFFKCLNNENLIKLPIPILSRIINKVQMGICNMNDIEKNQFVEFMFKCIDKYKTKASVLFLNLDLKDVKIDIISRLIVNYSDVFDFRMIDQNFLMHEINKLRQENSVLLNELENEKKKSTKINEELNIYKLNESRIKKENEKIKKENCKINKENKQLKTIIQNRFKNAKSNELEILKNDDINNNEKSTDINVDQFNALPLSLQQINAYKISNSSTGFTKYFFCRINILCIFLRRINDINISGIEIMCNNNESLSCLKNEYQIKLRHEIVENLFEKNMLNSIKNPKHPKFFSSFHFELLYPHFSFPRIYEQVLFIKNLNNEISIGIKISGVSELGTFFKDDKNISSVEIDLSARSIGDYSFSNCSSLTQIIIPSSIISIGDGAFNNCSMLKQISIPSSLKSLNDSVFCGCESLTNITIPTSVITIGQNAFKDCKLLTHIIIPSSVTSIGPYAFSGCSSLKQISISHSVKSIGIDAFNGCISLQQVSIPWSLKYKFSPQTKKNIIIQ